MTTVSKDSTNAEKASAATTVSGLLDEVAQLINTVTTTISTDVPSTGDIRIIKNLVVELVREVSCTLRGVLTVLPVEGACSLTLRSHELKI